MPVLDMYNEFRDKFPSVTEKTDAVHTKFWGDIDAEFCYSWFESLAKLINQDMARDVDPEAYLDVFEFLRSSYLKSDEKVKECIDVAFTENMFWQIPEDKAKPYWQVFPIVLKDLYIDFHNRKPA